MIHTHTKYFPNSLRKYRKARGLQQVEVASILGVKHTSMISRWEQGVCLPNTVNLIRLAILYRTMADALVLDLWSELKDDILTREVEVLKARETAGNHYDR